MTTLDEISASKEANYCFWTEQARFILCCYREAYGEIEKLKYKRAFIKAMTNRRNKEYLN